jgi:hypothetical protein
MQEGPSSSAKGSFATRGRAWDGYGDRVHAEEKLIMNIRIAFLLIAVLVLQVVVLHMLLR